MEQKLCYKVVFRGEMWDKEKLQFYPTYFSSNHRYSEVRDLSLIYEIGKKTETGNISPIFAFEDFISAFKFWRGCNFSSPRWGIKYYSKDWRGKGDILLCSYEEYSRGTPYQIRTIDSLKRTIQQGADLKTSILKFFKGRSYKCRKSINGTLAVKSVVPLKVISWELLVDSLMDSTEIR